MQAKSIWHRIGSNQKHEWLSLPFVHCVHIGQGRVLGTTCGQQSRVREEIGGLIVKEAHGGRVGTEFGDEGGNLRHELARLSVGAQPDPVKLTSDRGTTIPRLRKRAAAAHDGGNSTSHVGIRASGTASKSRRAGRVRGGTVASRSREFRDVLPPEPGPGGARMSGAWRTCGPRLPENGRSEVQEAARSAEPPEIGRDHEHVLASRGEILGE